MVGDRIGQYVIYLYKFTTGAIILLKSGFMVFDLGCAGKLWVSYEKEVLVALPNSANIVHHTLRQGKPQRAYCRGKWG